jgi:hypothetical protein
MRPVFGPKFAVCSVPVICRASTCLANVTGKYPECHVLRCSLKLQYPATQQVVQLIAFERTAPNAPVSRYMERMATRSLCTVLGDRPHSSSQYGHMPSTLTGTACWPGPAGCTQPLL